ncbi:YibE/F family protein [Candidatus Moduliflexus flocculans]|uniref:YibE/F family protein n=1 Tax=Candidatus Moduliflexus flocculans TaxID=1499966 RepID=A0A081BMZ1_9BACT|nr:YibE/F family protein [Candidatus Moduliflexus flocculans]
MTLLAFFRRLFDRHNLFALVIFALTVGLFLMPNWFRTPYQPAEGIRVRGRVTQVDNSLIQQYGILKAGSQSLIVEILGGDFKGQRVDARNDLIGKMETDKMFVNGDVAMVILTVNADNQIISATAYDHYRLHIEAGLLLLFGVFLVLFAKSSGARAMLSFIFAMMMLWKILLPGILKGYDPILLALAVVTLITAATLSLVAGINKTALVALLGSLLGILLTCGTAMLILPLFRLHGAVQPFSETLLYSGFESLNLNRIFLSAIFIGASGAVLDVAIDISTAMFEVADKRPDLSRKELMFSGFAVGRNMTSTMVTTLLMAYISGYMSLLMVFMAQGIPPINFINTNYVAAEILRTVVGSFGLVTVAPFTAVVGGLIYAKHPRVARNVAYESVGGVLPAEE